MPLLGRTGIISSGGYVPTGTLAWWKTPIVGLSDSDPVATWPDSSGNGFDLAQATLDKRPLYKTGIINGYDVVRGDGATDFLYLADFWNNLTGAAASMFFVTQFADNEYIIVDAFRAADSWWRYSGTGLSYMELWRSTRADGFSTMPASGTYIYSLIDNGTTYTLRQNGVQIGQVASAWQANQRHIYVFSKSNEANNFAGDIPELIIYNSGLSDVDRDLVEGYLSTKYAIALP